MDLVVLNPFKSTTDPLRPSFQPARVVEGHESLIWTERYRTAGDFTRVSHDISGTLNKLPLYTLASDGVTQIPTVVSLRDSTVPMIVELHTITRDNQNAPVITTTGRSFETVLDRRTTVPAPPPSSGPITPFQTSAYNGVDLAYKTIKQIITNANGTGIVADIIPELHISDPTPSGGWTGTASTLTADLGELYAYVLQQISNAGYGFRAVRPSSLTTKTIDIQMYEGRDRTEAVVFDTRFGQFDSEQYLLSQSTWKNVDQISGATKSAEVYSESSFTGLMRRTIYNDASSVLTGAVTVTDDMIKNLGLIDLAKYPETVLFSGEVSRDIAGKYGDAANGYLLGDLVTLTGEIAPTGGVSLSQAVRVAEFIRADDTSGYKAYPTFEVISGSE